MNKIKKLIFMVLAGYVLFFSITLNLYAKPTNSHVTDDGGVPGDTYTNLSLFPTIRVNSSGPRLSLVTNSFENGYNNILSNTGSSEDVMGKIKTDFQAFSVNTNLVRETFLIVSYRIYVEPQDNVMYQNGILGWGTAYNDAATQYVKVTTPNLSTGISSLHGTGPASTSQTGTRTSTIGSVPVTISDGYGYTHIIYMPTYSESLEVTVDSVMLHNDSSPANGDVNMLYDYTDGFDQRFVPNILYGYFVIRIAGGITSYHVIAIVEAELIISEGDFWGCATGLFSKNFDFWVNI